MDERNGNQANQEKWMTPREAAEAIGVSVSAMATWRMRGTGPAFYKPGRIRYLRSDIEAFIAARRREPTEKAS